MDAETLSLLKELQGVFLKNMGPLQEGDGVLLEFEPTKYYVGFVTQTKTMEAKLISADLVYVRWNSNKPWRAQSCDKRDWAEEHFIRIPDLYSRDPERPERGLWGMVDWSLFAKHLNDEGNLFLLSYNKKWQTGRVNTGRCNPYLALLKAIKWQEE